MATKIRLVSCDRYHFRGNLYEAGKVYRVNDDKAKIMLRKQDGFDRNYFARYEDAPAKSAVVLAAEAAQAAAVAAAQLAADENRREEIVEEADADSDVAIEDDIVEKKNDEEVDMDDDPALDHDLEASFEEVVNDADVDRADGSEVEV